MEVQILILKINLLLNNTKIMIQAMEIKTLMIENLIKLLPIFINTPIQNRQIPIKMMKLYFDI